MQGGEKLAYIALDIGSSYLKGAVLYPERLEISFIVRKWLLPISLRYPQDMKSMLRRCLSRSREC